MTIVTLTFLLATVALIGVGVYASQFITKQFLSQYINKSSNQIIFHMYKEKQTSNDYSLSTILGIRRSTEIDIFKNQSVIVKQTELDNDYEDTISFIKNYQNANQATLNPPKENRALYQIN